jgi:hypothetical protein
MMAFSRLDLPRLNSPKIRTRNCRVRQRSRSAAPAAARSAESTPGQRSNVSSARHSHRSGGSAGPGGEAVARVSAMN